MIRSDWSIKLGGGAFLALALAACQPVVRQSAGPPHAFLVASTKPLSTIENPKPFGTLRAYFVNVGNGMCHVIQCPGKNVAIVDDCGSRNAKGALDESKTAALVQNLTKGRDVLVIATHRDDDHSNYLPSIFPNPKTSGIKLVWAGGTYGKYYQPMRAWFDLANADGAEVRINDAPPEFNSTDFTDGWHNGSAPETDLACGDASTYVLTVDTGASANTSSLVLMLDYNGEKIILPGDATAATEEQAIENFESKASGKFLNTEVLETSHHGAGSAKDPSSNTTKWAKATVPYYLISSAGWHGTYWHPRCAALDRYANATGKRLLSTADKHTLWCGTDTSSWEKRAPEHRTSYSTSSNGMLVVDITALGSKAPRTTLFYETLATAGPVK